VKFWHAPPIAFARRNYFAALLYLGKKIVAALMFQTENVNFKFMHAAHTSGMLFLQNKL
jgi:hypothetical protein